MATKIADTTPIADGASLEPILLTKAGLQAVQRAIMDNTSPQQKPTIAAIQTALEAIVTP
jgi:hypothetical protein